MNKTSAIVFLSAVRHCNLHSNKYTTTKEINEKENFTENTKDYIMIKNFFFVSTTIILLSSCNGSQKQATTFNKDTALKRYLQLLDTLPYYDTTDLNYKALKAYQNNDSGFFLVFLAEQKRKAAYIQQWANSDTCIKLRKLQELGAEQAYRFKCTPAFCSMPIVATVTKKGKSVKLHFIVYQNQYDTTQCRVINEINMNLTDDNWNDFYQKLMFADIWGLKRENGIHGVDGSTMEFMAYENIPTSSRPVRQCYIERWVYSTLGDAFGFILKLSKNKKGCYWVE